jgi:PIN domain nuclease of toxin-antitoxin system
LPGVLLDSHTLYWLVSGSTPLTDEALVAIGEAQRAGNLYVSPISAWELTIAARKPLHKDPPNLGTGAPSKWFATAVHLIEAKIIPIKQRICFAAAAVIVDTGHKDPGDCYLVASSRVRKIPIMTRDRVMQEMGANGYLEIIDC